jgi:hypothetical protein
MLDFGLDDQEDSLASRVQGRAILRPPAGHIREVEHVAVQGRAVLRPARQGASCW